METVLAGFVSLYPSCALDSRLRGNDGIRGVEEGRSPFAGSLRVSLKTPRIPLCHRGTGEDVDRECRDESLPRVWGCPPIP